MVRTTSWHEHEQAVDKLRESYQAIPAGQVVRLAKKTSNLFRPRAHTSAPGLDVSGLDGVLSIDPVGRTAEVQGMCTYERLVEATLAHGLMPLVVPQLRTITLGGAVAGLGIESTSFRNGLPHESVVEMDVFTGAGEVVTTRPAPGEHSDLFDAFPNSYGSLGYAIRLRIELEAVPSHVELRHVRFDDAELMSKTMGEVVDTREYDDLQVDGLDGVAFAPGEYYLTLARFVSTDTGDGASGVGDRPAHPTQPSDYAGQQVYYRSIQERAASGQGADLLTTLDYLWRWDTDWFWCSAPFGAQHPVVRRLWPRRYRRSDVYHRILSAAERSGFIDWLDRRQGNLLRERVVQDIEVPLAGLPAFLSWFDEHVGMRPVWLCPLVAHGTSSGERWPTYPLEPGSTYVNVGFWGTVHVGPEATQGPTNRAIETAVHELGGHKSLYSEAFYARDTFDRLYDGVQLAFVKRRYDPDDRLLSLYDKVVRQQ